MRKLSLLVGVAGMAASLFAAKTNQFEAVALVDSLDFADVFDIEKSEGNLQVLDHVLLTHATDVWWRDKGGGRLRYPSKAEEWPIAEFPFDKHILPSESVWGHLRQETPNANAFPVIRRECEKRGIGFGIHTTLEETHNLISLSSNWTLAHPQFWGRVKGEKPWMGCCALGYPEVIEHKLELVDERLSFKPGIIFLDFCRDGGYFTGREYVKPVTEEWRRRYGCEPPSDNYDPRWLSLVSENIMGYLRKFAAKCHQKGCRFAVGFKYMDGTDSRESVYRRYGVDWTALAADGTIDALVAMGVKYDRKDVWGSMERIYRGIMERRGRADVYFHLSVYDWGGEGIATIAKNAGMSEVETTERLLRLSKEVGARGVVMECVDYKNYKPALCDEIGKAVGAIPNVPKTVLELPPGQGNPRNSEGDFIKLKDGRLMFVYSHYTSGSGGDHDPATLSARYSKDGGRTWSPKSTVVVANEGKMNVMCPALLRLGDGSLAIFYLRKNSESDCRPVMRVSKDEGKSWSSPVLCVPDSENGYYVLENGRAVRLRSGRIVLPLCLFESKGGHISDWHGELVCWYSDDEGRTWQRGCKPFTAYDASGNRVTLQEPGIVELKDGRALMYVRTIHGRQWFFYSSDGCKTWTAGRPGNLMSPCSPATLKRLSNGDIAAVWNDHAQYPQYAARDGIQGRRVPLSVAVSSDEGDTWHHRREFGSETNGWYCYSGMLESGNQLLVGYCAKDGLRHSSITSLPLDWIYGGGEDMPWKLSFEGIKEGPFMRLSTVQGVWSAKKGAAEISSCSQGKGVRLVGGNKRQVCLELPVGVSPNIVSFSLVRKTAQTPFALCVEGRMPNGTWKKLATMDAKTPAGKVVPIALPKLDASMTAFRFTGTSAEGVLILADSSAGAAKVAISSLDGKWELTRKDRKPEMVEVPHDWAIAGPFDPDAQGRTGKLPWRGEGVYRRDFGLTDVQRQTLAAGGTAYLEFDGVMASPKVRLNGNDVGGWDYGYMSFTLNVTAALRSDTNRLEVACSTLDHDSRWYPGAGIYRPVRLKVLPREHVIPNTVKIVATSISAKSATVRVDYESSLSGKQSRVIVVDRPRLWDVTDPYLYEVEILGERFRYGIRTCEFTVNDGFHLNGRRLQLKGVNLHSDLGPLGMAFDRDAAKRQLILMKEMGVNAIRTSHNAPAPQLLDLCDEMGFVVWDECFDKWNGTSGRAKDVNLEDYVKRNLQAFVRRDRNHPSVVIWSIGNEIQVDAEGMSRERFREFRAAVRAEDTTRQVGIGACVTKAIASGMFDELDVIGWNYRRDYQKMRDVCKTKPLVYSESASAVSSFGYYANPPAGWKVCFDPAVLEVCSYDHCASWGADIPDVELFRMETDRYCAGEFVWTGIDYLGEPTPWTPSVSHLLKTNLPERVMARSSYFGAADLTGVPKDRYYIYRSHWKPESRTIHILPHWNWSKGQNVPVYVYTSGDEAELFLNGRSLGRRRKQPVADYSPDFTPNDAWVGSDFATNGYLRICDRYRLRWLDVPYCPGELRAVAYKKGVCIGEEVVRTAGEPKTLRLTDDPCNSPDAKTRFIRVEVVDAKGTRCPLATQRLKFSVLGDATLKAVANGDARGQDAFSGIEMPAYGGMAMAVVRIGSGKGASAVLRVEADGLIAGKEELGNRREEIGEREGCY